MRNGKVSRTCHMTEVSPGRHKTGLSEDSQIPPISPKCLRFVPSSQRKQKRGNKSLTSSALYEKYNYKFGSELLVFCGENL
jgi:hypothetical protein